MHVGRGAEVGGGRAVGEVEVDQRHPLVGAGARGQRGGELDGDGGGAAAADRADHGPAARR